MHPVLGRKFIKISSSHINVWSCQISQRNPNGIYGGAGCAGVGGVTGCTLHCVEGKMGRGR